MSFTRAKLRGGKTHSIIKSNFCIKSGIQISTVVMY